MNQPERKPSKLLHQIMKSEGLVAEETGKAATCHFQRISFDMTSPTELVTTVCFELRYPDGRIVTDARQCVLDKCFTPVDVMQAIASGDMPPPWAWPVTESDTAKVVSGEFGEANDPC